MKNLKLHFLLFGAEAEINFRRPGAAVVRKHLGPMELLLPPPPGFYSMDPGCRRVVLDLQVSAGVNG